MDKGSGSSIFPDPDLGDPKRPDPDPQHWFLEPRFIYIEIGHRLRIKQTIQQGRPFSFVSKFFLRNIANESETRIQVKKVRPC